MTNKDWAFFWDWRESIRGSESLPPADLRTLFEDFSERVAQMKKAKPVNCKSVTKYDAERPKLNGLHKENVAFIIDEAGDIPDEVIMANKEKNEK